MNPERVGRWGLAALLGVLVIQAQAASLVHTNDLLGELEPCGCRTNPQGGLSREQNLLAKIQAGPYLRLDAGDLLFQSAELPEVLKEQAEVQAGYLLRALALGDPVVVTPGEKEFALGLKTFERLRRGADKEKVEFISANLYNGSKRWLAAHVVRDLGQKAKIGIFGLSGEALHWPSPLKARSAIEAARKEVEALKKANVQLILLLSHQGLEADEALVKKVPGIDAVIGGHSQSFLQKPKRVGKTWIFQSSFRNQYLGVIPLDQLLALKKSGEEDWPHIGEPGSYNLYGLDAGYDSPVDKPTPLDALVTEFKGAVAKLNSKRQTETLRLGGGGAGASYQTFPKCAECHLTQFDFWRKTAHASALKTLVDKDQALNKECLGCHTVGLGQKSGWTNPSQIAELEDSKVWGVPELHSFLERMRAAESSQEPVEVQKGPKIVLQQALHQIRKAWSPVQCENCHGAGGEHPFGGADSAGPHKAVSTQTCITCHTLERAPNWYKEGVLDVPTAQAKLKSISCPAGP